MNTIKFKTNINCGGCLNSVTPHLNKLQFIVSWDVKIENPDKILTVRLNKKDEKAVIEAVKEAGFEIKKL